MSLIEQLFGLSGKVAIVTGGGQGLGKAIALALAGAGADVAVLARTSEKLRAVAEEIEALGRRSLAVSCDVTDPDSVNAAVEHVYGTFGRIDILVNGAGTISRTPAAEMSREDWDPVIDTNLSGTFWMSQAVARKMIPQKSGKIINIASATSAIGLPRRIAVLGQQRRRHAADKSPGRRMVLFGHLRQRAGPGLFPHRDQRCALSRRGMEGYPRFTHRGGPSRQARRPGRSRHLSRERRLRLRHGTRPLRRRRIYDERYDLRHA